MFVSSGNEIKIWDSGNNSLVAEYSPNYPSIGTIHSFSIRPDNAQIGCVFESGCIKFLNFESGFQEEILDVSEPKACCYDSASRQFAVGTMNSFLEIFDLKSQTMKKKLWKINPPSGPVNCISWSKTDRNLATGHPNGTINIFNSVTNNFAKPLIHPKFDDLKSLIVTTLQWSLRNPPQFVSGYDDGSIILWDTNKNSAVSMVKAHNSPCTTALPGLGASLLLISSCLDGYINFFDCNTNKTVKTIQCRSGITSCDLSSNGSTMCVGTINGHVVIYDIRSGNQPLNTFKAHDTAVHCIKYSQNISFQPKSNNSSLYSTHSSQIENQSLIKKSSSFTSDLSQKNSLNPPISNPMSIYSPENMKITQKLRTQSSTSNLTTLIDTDFKTRLQPQLSSTANFNTPNANKVESKMSKDKGDIYSPLINGTVDDNNSSPNQLVSRLSSTKLNQTNTPKTQSTISAVKIQLSNSASNGEISADNDLQVKTDLNEIESINSNAYNEATSQSKFSLPLDMIREIVNDSNDNLRYEIMSENFKFKAEMIREFMELRNCIEESFKAASVNDALVAEIQRLREENKRLKKLY